MLNKYEWYRRLRGGVWIKWLATEKWENVGWILDKNLNHFDYHETEDYRGQSVWQRTGIKYLLEKIWYEIKFY